MFDVEQQQAWSEQAEKIVAEAAQEELVELPPLLAEALVMAVRVHHLTRPGVYALVTAYGNSERQAGRLPLKPKADLAESLKEGDLG
jgi:hypothetical protein